MIEDVEPEPATEARRFEARLTSVDRSPFLVTVLVAIFVGLAFLKPWVVVESPAAGSAVEAGARIDNRPAASRDDRTAASPAPPAAEQAVIGLCHEPSSWRTATIETWRDQTVRVWRAVEPEPAGRPLDPAIPVVPAVGTSVPAIGYCAPTGGPDQPEGPASVRAWRVEGTAVQPLQLRQIAPIDVVSPYGALYGPPLELGATSSWPNGLVVFRYEELESHNSRWFGIEVSGTNAPGTPPRHPNASAPIGTVQPPG